jgi:hypothetical protein
MRMFGGRTAGKMNAAPARALALNVCRDRFACLQIQLMPPPPLLLLLLAVAAAQPSLARPGPECLPRVGPHRWVPQFHLMGPMVRVDGMLWPGDLNDANGILEHRGVFHAMFQTPVWQNGVNGTGQPPACHGDLALCGPHAWAHVVSENGVR